MGSSAAESKKCPRCGKMDVTDFSKCRYCGTRYDFNAIDDGFQFDFGKFMKGPGVFVMCGLMLVVYVMRDSVYSAAGYISKRILVSSEQELKETDGILAKEPSNYDALIRRADANSALFHNEQAVADLTQAIAIKPTPDLYRQRAMCYQAMTREAEAASDRKTADSMH